MATSERCSSFSPNGSQFELFRNWQSAKFDLVIDPGCHKFRKESDVYRINWGSGAFRTADMG
jgi:hypothetical protein